MLRSAAAPHAVQQVIGHRRGEATVGHVVRDRSFVGDLRPGKKAERAGAEIHERSHACHRGAGADRGIAGFRGRRIEDALGKILLEPIGQRALRAETEYVPADDAYARVGAKAVMERVDQRCRIALFFFAHAALSCANTCSNAVSGAGNGLLSAKSAAWSMRLRAASSSANTLRTDFSPPFARARASRRTGS